MDVQTSLKNLIQNIPAYSLTGEDQKKIKFEGLPTYIFSKVNSSKYRSTTLSDDLKKSFFDKISYSVENNLPIHFSLPFGAYKNPNLPTSPYPDWAEVFSTTYLREYFTPIAAAYKPGVLMEFFMVELFVHRLNRNPQERVDSYVNQFNELLEEFSKFLPKNIQYISTNLRSQISQEEAIKRLDKKIKELRKTWDQLPQKERDYKLLRAKRNATIKPEDKGQEDKIYLESALAHDAFSSEAWADETIPWAFAKDMLPIGYSYTQGWAIHLRSCSSSTINYWVGIGALKQKGENYLPLILSKNQYESVKKKIEMINVNLFGKKFINLQQVPLIKE